MRGALVSGPWTSAGLRSVGSPKPSKVFRDGAEYVAGLNVDQIVIRPWSSYVRPSLSGSKVRCHAAASARSCRCGCHEARNWRGSVRSCNSGSNSGGDSGANTRSVGSLSFPAQYRPLEPDLLEPDLSLPRPKQLLK